MIFFAKSLDRLVEQGTENSSFFMMYDGEWYKYKFAGAWSAISMATIKPSGKDRTVVAISPRGAYWEVAPKAIRETHNEIKEWGNPLRALATVGDSIYACGMGRTVMRRRGPGAWEEMGPGTLDSDEGEIVGFEDLAGFAENEMYAVGWRGEIWRFANRRWRRLDSPVSGNLNAVCCGGDGRVYVVGDDGTMLRGRNEVWEVLRTDRMDNLMDVAFHQDMVYVATDFEILKLEGDLLSAEEAFVDPEDPPATCLHLLEAADGLISLGTKDLFRLRNAVWERLV